MGGGIGKNLQLEFEGAHGEGIAMLDGHASINDDTVDFGSVGAFEILDKNTLGGDEDGAVFFAD